jgi:hypothetical protein
MPLQIQLGVACFKLCYEINLVGFEPIYVRLNWPNKELIKLGFLFMHKLLIGLDSGFNTLSLSPIGYPLLSLFQLELMLFKVHSWSDDIRQIIWD